MPENNVDLHQQRNEIELLIQIFLLFFLLRLCHIDINTLSKIKIGIYLRSERDRHVALVAFRADEREKSPNREIKLYKQ